MRHRNWYLQHVRLNEAAHVEPFRVLPNLISALVKQWRLECHMFHFPCGECTMTLEDVALHLGLPINGFVITRSTGFNMPMLQDMCQV